MPVLPESERPGFSALLDRTRSIYGQPPLPAAIKQIWWDLLAPRFDPDRLARAFERHLCDPDRGRRFPYPADLIAAAEADQAGVPSADEAWSIALASFDETRTVCTTPEILEAGSLAALIYTAGDVVGARMAFRAAYERLQRQRREEGTPVRWTLSLGWDPEGRAPALQHALSARRLPHVPSAVTDGLGALSECEAARSTPRGELPRVVSPDKQALTKQWLEGLRAIVRCASSRTSD